MAEPEKAKERKELSMEIRLLLAFILMGVVLFVTPYFYKPQPPTPNAPKPATSEVSKPTPQPVKRETKPAAPASGSKIGADAEQQYSIETDVYRIVFSNRGAVVRSWVLSGYHDSTGKPLELVNLRAVEKVGYPFALEFGETRPPVNPDTALFAAKKSADGLGIDFELSDGGTYLRKSFRFERSKFISQVSSEATQNGRSLPHLLCWRGGFGDATVPNAPSVQHTLYFDLAQNKHVVSEAKRAKDGPISDRGNYSFAGIEDSYFAAVALPAVGSGFEIRTFGDSVMMGSGEKEQPHVGAGLGGEAHNSFSLFVGPKDLDLLKQVDPKLVGIVDFGWFSFLAKPLFLGLKWLDSKWIHNWGWSIVVITILINFLLLPLKITSLKSMKKMQALQPEIKALNEKYKGISIRDPRKSQQNEEMMALYKRHGVNPMGGCVPMLLQIPFFFAFYKVLTVAIELRGADWLWVTDLSQPEHLPIRILPIAMIVSQFIMQKMTPATTPDPAQQRIMMFMPLMMGFFFYSVSSGLVLYWFTGNIVSIAQQVVINKTGHAPQSVLAGAKAGIKSPKKTPRK